MPVEQSARVKTKEAPTPIGPTAAPKPMLAPALQPAKPAVIDGRNLPSTKNSAALRKFKKFWKLGDREFNTQYFDITTEGDLVAIEGNYQYNVRELVEKYGSPLEVYFPFILEDRLQDLQDLFRFSTKFSGYRGKFVYHYPMKVNQNREFILPIVGEGANLETASANELWLVKRLWEQGKFNTNIRVICNGPKTDEYLNLINELRQNNLSIVPIVEEVSEFERLKDFKGELGVRLDLNVKVNSHWDKKIDRFGLTPAELLRRGKIRNLKLLHYHLGSQIEHLDDIILPVKEIMSVYSKLRPLHPGLDTLDIGGGLPIPYDRKRRYSIDGLVRRIIRYLQKTSDHAHVPHPNIIAEWGRYIVAPAQMTIYRILSQKVIPKGNAKRWYNIDGSFMNDLLDTWALRQRWHVVPVSNATAHKLTRTWLAGLSCDSDDKYSAHGQYVLLPRLEHLPTERPLYVAFLDTGAYQDALASHHCLLSSPAKIMAQHGEITIIRKRETAADVGKMFGW
ncbi:MAG: hypothetical protein HYZ09_03380 [Candidatus Kerfeldbacteria bacterium]|nr:hypothetical protein [Candidatus Kerfeldbacteria bacterium]